MWYWWRIRHINKFNKLQNPKISPTDLMKVQKQFNGGNAAYSANDSGATGYP